MDSLTRAGLTPLRLAVRSWKSINEDDVFGRAAGLSYYFMLALFPLLLFLLSLFGLLAGPGSELRANLLQLLARAIPASASQLIYKTIDEVTKNSGGGKLTFGLLAALWTASNGVSAVMESLNIAYHVKETRSWLRKHVVSVGLTVALSILVTIALTLVLYGGKIADFMVQHFGLGAPFKIAWLVLQWPIVVAFMLVGYALIYYFAPNLDEPKWTWVTPGAVIGFALWVIASVALRIYLHFFNSYSATYGSLGAAIILMLWLYLTGAAILIGGEVNAEIKHAEVDKEKQDERRRMLDRRFEQELKAA
ncbi:MAG TPA: YihY/virulence factor BrkB family protein [Terriglobales bacterium]